MNTIIPNELSFNLDLNDLPARVNSVAQNEVRKILGGNWWGAWACLKDGDASQYKGTVEIDWGGRAADGKWGCNFAFAACDGRCEVKPTTHENEDAYKF